MSQGIKPLRVAGRRADDVRKRAAQDVAPRAGRSATTLIAAGAFPLGMTNLHIYDNDNHLYLTAMNLPHMSVFRFDSASEATSNGVPHMERLDLEAGICRILGVLARGAIERMREVPTGSVVCPLGLETWIVRPSPSGRLSEYFAGLPSHTRRRVFIHRTPVRSPWTQARCLWDLAYETLEADRGSGFKRVENSAAALRQGVEVLTYGLAAYREGPQATRRYFLESLGHPVRHEIDEPPGLQRP